MLPQQREAVCTLVAWVVGLIAFSVIAAAFRGHGAEVSFSVMVLVIVAMWVIRALNGVSWKKLDERDQLIRFKAGMAAAAAVVALVVVGCVALYYTFHACGMVPIRYLSYMAFAAMASLYVCWTAAILLLYRKGA
jgi:hypothetical protein